MRFDRASQSPLMVAGEEILQHFQAHTKNASKG
jgi:hypothetical protein